jgi:hypothetical protein
VDPTAASQLIFIEEYRDVQGQEAFNREERKVRPQRTQRDIRLRIAFLGDLSGFSFATLAVKSVP